MNTRLAALAASITTAVVLAAPPLTETGGTESSGSPDGTSRAAPVTRRGVLVLDGRQYRYNPPSDGKTAEVTVPGRGVYVIDSSGSVVTNMPFHVRRPVDLTQEQKAIREARRERIRKNRAKEKKAGRPRPD